MFRPSSQMASAAAAAASSPPPERRRDFPSTQSETEWEADYLASSKPPSLDQLFALTALPSGIITSGKGRGGKRSKPKLVKEGQVVSKSFDALGNRPQPTNGISLEQTIVLEMTAAGVGLLASNATSGLSTYASKVFAISDYTGASALLAVFDQYRIEQIECWLEFGAPNSTSSFPLLYSAVDLDDANTPTSLGQVQDHQGAIVAGGPSGHYHKWKPHVAIAAFSGAFTSYSNMSATWIDSASPNVQHYGLKVATVSTGAALTVNYTTRVVVSFRAPSIN